MPSLLSWLLPPGCPADQDQPPLSLCQSCWRPAGKSWYLDWRIDSGTYLTLTLSSMDRWPAEVEASQLLLVVLVLAECNPGTSRDCCHKVGSDIHMDMDNREVSEESFAVDTEEVPRVGEGKVQVHTWHQHPT